MTLTTLLSEIEFPGTGSQTVFTVPFKFFDNVDLIVNLLDVDGNVIGGAAQILDTDYTVTGAGADTGGTVTMTVAPGATERLRINRHLDFLQQTDYINNDKFPADTHETALDRLKAEVQELANRTGGANFVAGGFLGRSQTNFDQWDGEATLLSNILDPVLDTDAATKGFVDAAITGTGQLPPSTAVNDMLFGNGSAFVIKTLAQGLDILKVNPGVGLINGATDLQVDVGTVLNKIVQVGAGNKIAESLLPNLVTQVEAEAGTVVTQRMWSPERVKQAIDAIAVIHPRQQLAKAWGRITDVAGTPTIQDSFNLASITDRGVGEYTINLTTALGNANYAFVGGTEGLRVIAEDEGTPVRTTSALNVEILITNTGALSDRDWSFAFFGDDA